MVRRRLIASDVREQTNQIQLQNLNSVTLDTVNEEYFSECTSLGRREFISQMPPSAPLALEHRDTAQWRALRAPTGVRGNRRTRRGTESG